MKTLKGTYLILLLTLLPFLNSQAQVYGITPLHKFMQANADTTLLLEHESGWLGPPKYWVLSKKGDTTTAYVYEVPYKSNILMPKAIKIALNKVNSFNPNDKIEVNKFFRAVPMPPKYNGKIWATLMNKRPWSIADDNIDGRGCPVAAKDKTEIDDGGTTKLYLITPNEIKTLSFYAPNFYEQQCPGRKGRQSILKIEKLFADFFNPEK